MSRSAQVGGPLLCRQQPSRSDATPRGSAIARFSPEWSRGAIYPALWAPVAGSRGPRGRLPGPERFAACAFRRSLPEIVGRSMRRRGKRARQIALRDQRPKNRRIAGVRTRRFRQGGLPDNSRQQLRLIGQNVCPASQARRGGDPRGGAPSARPLVHAPPPAVRHGDAPEEVDPGLAPAFGRPGGLRWDFPFSATKSRFVGQVLLRRPSCAASRFARRDKTGLTHPKNLPLCAPGGTMTPASHPRQPGPHGPVSHKPRFHGRNPIIRSHDLPFRRGRRSSTPRGGGASRPRLPPRPHRALPAGRTNHRFRALDPPASRTHIPSECLKSGGGFKAPKRGCRHAPTASSGKTICPINPSQPVAGQPKKEAGPQARPICAKPEGSPWRICWPGTSPDTRPVRRAPQRDDPTSP